jgi:hypothetical protein
MTIKRIAGEAGAVHLVIDPCATIFLLAMITAVVLIHFLVRESLPPPASFFNLCRQRGEEMLPLRVPRRREVASGHLIVVGFAGS